MKELRLKNDKRLAIVDEEDYERLSIYNWFVSGNSKNHIQRYHKDLTRKASRLQPNSCKAVSLASEIMHKTGEKFDHKDRDFLNNKKENLRECDSSQNGANSPKRSGTSSKYKGVHWSVRDKRWVAQIKFQYKPIRLGSYKEEIDAARAYDKAATQFFKEFACLNFPII